MQQFGLLNSDTGGFTEYIKVFISTAFTLVVQMALINLSILTLANEHLIYGIAISIVAINTPTMLEKYMVRPHGNVINSAGNTARTIRALTPKFITSKK